MVDACVVVLVDSQGSYSASGFRRSGDDKISVHDEVAHMLETWEDPNLQGGLAVHVVNVQLALPMVNIVCASGD